jgi:hypothetical protein
LFWECSSSAASGGKNYIIPVETHHICVSRVDVLGFGNLTGREEQAEIKASVGNEVGEEAED